MFVDVNTGANIAKKSAVMGKSWDSGIVDPPIFAIMPAKPVLHSKTTVGVKVAQVNLQTPVDIVLMNALRPTIADLLRHAATCECQPRLVKPNAALVFAGNPNHYRRGIQHFAKTRIKAAWGFIWPSRNCARV